ncbi:hypothetical protein IWW36_001551 [Coemansia brasiliensis]|uniref:Uncharacterized protein n=1 Tax=Coemansia brasiliensis TaxID=2650707 RepID=A0A9W8I9I8_9FUNG|nr:hypothetical protein IWW36_001551 [Coemansia brasiliensis]
MGTCMQQLSLVDSATHADNVVETAKRILYLRTTTQIDELMNYASTAIHQRWDFLGPTTAQAPNADLFQQIDSALQWTSSSSSIGDYIRHAHFALELTEDQAEILNAANVRFRFLDRNTAYAAVPFATFDEQKEAFVVELVWEDSQWKYADVRAVEGTLPGHVTVAEAIAAAETEFPEAALNSSDDDYWGQYSDSESGDNKEAAAGGSKPAATTAADANTHHLMASSLEHALAAAATAARAIGIGEHDFLELAAKSYHQ